ncbi:MAG: manganese efflux pump [Candidatus Krumholzibacteriota bacterium]|nr:manganese efflux pump [Candidatus Krumholzibacteriota bacterium]
MSFISILILSFSLAMDAFAVSISSGISLRKAGIRSALIIAWFFGFFQSAMTLIGYSISSSISSYIERFDHWVACGLLVLIGAKMIGEAVKNRGPCRNTLPGELSLKILLFLAVATSIDALAAGGSLSVLSTALLITVLTIGVVTFSLSYLGVIFGKKLGCNFGYRMEIGGGVVLVILGMKIIVAEYLV